MILILCIAHTNSWWHMQPNVKFSTMYLFVYLGPQHWARGGTNILIVPRFRESVGTLNLIRPSVCLSVCPSVTKTLTLAITFALLQIELWYLVCVFLVTRPFRWYHVVTLTVTFDLLQGQICCRAGDHNSLNLLVKIKKDENSKKIKNKINVKYNKQIYAISLSWHDSN